MSRVVLCTSSSGLDDLSISHQVQMIRLNIKINNVTFVDGKNINAKNLNKLMLNSPNAVARTSPASEQDVFAQFSNLYQQGYREFFVICVSSELSQSFFILNQVKERFTNQIKIFIYDSKAINFPEAALAYEADVLLQQGKSFTEIANHLDTLRANSCVYFSLYSLHYIIRNKKLSAPAGFLANLFNIRPVMEMTPDGKLVIKEKIRSTESALIRLGQHTLDFTYRQDSFIYILQGAFAEDTQNFLNILEHYYGVTNLPVIPAACVSLANHGPRGVAIGAFRGTLPQIIYKL